MLDEQDIARCVEVLKAGGVILYPTDTIWGIGCDATNPDAITKVYSIKQRDVTKSMLILVSSVEMLLEYVENPAPRALVLAEHSVRPTTIIFDRAKNLPINLLAADGSIGIRLVRSGFCSYLINQFGKPIVSTSANFSGEPSPSSFAAISPDLQLLADYVARSERHEIGDRASSSVVRFDEEGNLVVLRKG